LAELGAAAASHAHTWAQISGAPVQTTRWPSWTEVTGKPATMPPAAHTHTWAQVTGAPAAHTHTAAQGNADVVASGHSQIGSYMLAAVISSAAIPGLGRTIAGASLRPSGCYEYSYSGAGALAGTWKQFGHLGGANTDDRWDDRTTLFVRIA
nr:hypothetical protein [Aeromonas popoffii]